MTLRILVQLLITLLAIPVMAGFIEVFTKGISVAEIEPLIVGALILALILWGSNFIGRMEDQTWKAKFEKEGIFVAKIFVALIVLDTVIKIAGAILKGHGA